MNKSDPTLLERTEAHLIAEHVAVELAILLSIEQSLRIAIRWRTRDRGNNHKLSTLRFAARSFERHLTRARVLTDHGGYMSAITNANPHLSGDARKLRKLRNDLQNEFERIELELEHASPEYADVLDDICSDLARYLDSLAAHGQKEINLIQHSINQENGGSG